MITNLKTGEKVQIVRDVCTPHPAWVHEQLGGTPDESELQMCLDGFHVEMWYDGNKHLGPDIAGLEMFRDAPQD